VKALRDSFAFSRSLFSGTVHQHNAAKVASVSRAIFTFLSQNSVLSKIAIAALLVLDARNIPRSPPCGKKFLFLRPARNCPQSPHFDGMLLRSARFFQPSADELYGFMLQLSTRLVVVMMSACPAAASKIPKNGEPRPLLPTRLSA
jgi:hypothetical protein